MGLGLLPVDELPAFEGLRRWLLEDGPDPAAGLKVGLSFASVGNAPPLVAAALLRRTVDAPALPHTIFIFCAGSVCAQIDLGAALSTPDAPASSARLGIRWTNILSGDPDKPDIRLDYDEPAEFDWSSIDTAQPPIESLELTFNPRTSEGTLRPILRSVDRT
jgi:hypothetical protein